MRGRGEAHAERMGEKARCMLSGWEEGEVYAEIITRDPATGDGSYEAQLLTDKRVQTILLTPRWTSFLQSRPRPDWLLFLHRKEYVSILLIFNFCVSQNSRNI